MKSLLIILLSAFFLAGAANAQTGCLKDAMGRSICSPPQGTITKDALGRFVCGKGQCKKNALGTIMCSNEDGGFIEQDSLGRLICSGGECVKASESICKRMQ